ncbi:MAG: polyprenyl synthetase family protein [Candidatus Gracilibacteria bacterium]|nr:polyprenyl synthetase family protein [Candidatus Gracilibacteria bacterium]
MLPSWYNEYKDLIEKSLDKYLVDYFDDEKNIGLDIIKEATLYAVKGGKRIRSILALEFYFIFSKMDFEKINHKSDIIKFCIALELLHAYSLVHDDLPAMDNDDFRRGELTTWKKYGEANGILVGDLLNSLAFEILGEIGNSSLIKEFGKAVGLKGMIGGQVLDLYYENNFNELTLEKLLELHNKKTGKLIEISVLGGLILGNKSRNPKEKFKKEDIEKYLDFGKKIGLAFQVKDDLLDVEGTLEETGKSVGGEKKGFVYFIGIEKTKKYLNDLIEDSFGIIKNLKSQKLEFLVGYIRDRKK